MMSILHTILRAALLYLCVIITQINQRLPLDPSCYSFLPNDLHLPSTYQGEILKSLFSFD